MQPNSSKLDSSMGQPVQLAGRLMQIRRVDYILVTGRGRGRSSFMPFYEKAKARGSLTHEVACGHAVMVDDPATLTDLLITASQ
jgi:hypothetical protein